MKGNHMRFAIIVVLAGLACVVACIGSEPADDKDIESTEQGLGAQTNSPVPPPPCTGQHSEICYVIPQTCPSFGCSPIWFNGAWHATGKPGFSWRTCDSCGCGACSAPQPGMCQTC